MATGIPRYWPLERASEPCLATRYTGVQSVVAFAAEAAFCFTSDAAASAPACLHRALNSVSDASVPATARPPQPPGRARRRLCVHSLLLRGPARPNGRPRRRGARCAASVALDNVSVRVASEQPGEAGKTILKSVSLCVAPGELHMLVGPNGCGKARSPTLHYSLVRRDRTAEHGGIRRLRRRSGRVHDTRARRPIQAEASYASEATRNGPRSAALMRTHVVCQYYPVIAPKPGSESVMHLYPSGAVQSTLLRVIGGLETASAGSLSVVRPRRPECLLRDWGAPRAVTTSCHVRERVACSSARHRHACGRTLRAAWTCRLCRQAALVTPSPPCACSAARAPSSSRTPTTRS